MSSIGCMHALTTHTLPQAHKCTWLCGHICETQTQSDHICHANHHQITVNFLLNKSPFATIQRALWGRAHSPLLYLPLSPWAPPRSSSIAPAAVLSAFYKLSFSSKQVLIARMKIKAGTKESENRLTGCQRLGAAGQAGVRSGREHTGHGTVLVSWAREGPEVFSLAAQPRQRAAAR